MDNIDPPFATSHRLSITEISDIPMAREAVMDVAWGAGLNANAVVDAAIIAAELLENALSHGSLPVWLSVNALDEGSIAVEVFDADPRTPPMPVPDEWPDGDQEHGRGLLLCLSLSLELTAEPHDSGKVITAVVCSGPTDW